MLYFFKEQNNALQNIRKKMKHVEVEHNGCTDLLRCQASELKYSAEREEQLKRELEVRLFDYCCYVQKALTLGAVSFLKDGTFLLG